MDRRIRELHQQDGTFVGTYGQARSRWIAVLDEFQVGYQAAKKNSTAHASRLKELAELEKRVTDLRTKIASAKMELSSIGDLEDRYTNLREEWRQQHHRRFALMTGECKRLTQLSGGEIRATLRRGADAIHLTSIVREAVTGSGLRREKIEAIARAVAESDDPMNQWDDILQEFEALADFDGSNSGQDTLPPTPLLSGSGLAVTDIRKIASRLTNEGWLELALTELVDSPLFEYRAREAEYIPLVNASAGQQATALLKALLNQSGPPLIIDQPEEDLDNPVIFEIVEQLWNAKTRRQLIFVSHNANLVVNGDAELVVCCDYRAAGDQSGGKISGTGAIDIEEIRTAIKIVMEGGEHAFKLRLEKYGF